MIGAVIAMQKEADALLRQMTDVTQVRHAGIDIFSGNFCGKPVAVAVSRIGKVYAGAAAAVLIEKFGVTALVNFGLAGAVNPTLNVLDVVAVTRAVQYDFDLTRINGTPLGTLNERNTPWFDLATPSPIQAGLGTADRFSGDLNEAAMLSEMGCYVRDMEGCAVAQVAEQYGVPLYVWKVVSDVAGKNAPEEYAENAQKAMDVLAKQLPVFFAQIEEKQ